MTDTRTPSQRRKIMQAVKSKNTKPELLVRSILFRNGFRYRLHGKDLPGKPDIVFPGKRKAIFVHGCFWHGHDCRKGALPKSSIAFWTTKIVQNRERDEKNNRELAGLGWQTLTIWQCELRDLDVTMGRVCDFLKSKKPIDKLTKIDYDLSRYDLIDGPFL